MSSMDRWRSNEDTPAKKDIRRRHGEPSRSFAWRCWHTDGIFTPAQRAQVHRQAPPRALSRKGEPAGGLHARLRCEHWRAHRHQELQRAARRRSLRKGVPAALRQGRLKSTRAAGRRRGGCRRRSAAGPARTNSTAIDASGANLARAFSAARKGDMRHSGCIVEARREPR